MDMALGEPPLLPWWARYIHLQRVADRLGDDIRQAVGSRGLGLPN